MNLYVLDTDHTSFLQRGNEAIAQRIATLSYQEVAITTVTAEEQLRGRLKVIRRAASDDALVRAYSALQSNLDFFKNIRLLSFDVESARQYHALRRQKIRIGTQDLRIAATVLTAQAVLVTRNRRDFVQVPELAIEDWSR